MVHREIDPRVSFEVLSPLGEPVVEVAQAAPRLPSLEGKTVCEVSNRLFRGEETFPIIRKHLQDRYPTVKFISYTDLPSIHIGTRLEENLGDLDRALAEKGCDAVIAGNGA